jgi:hypothetical protein
MSARLTVAEMFAQHDADMAELKAAALAAAPPADPLAFPFLARVVFAERYVRDIAARGVRTWVTAPRPATPGYVIGRRTLQNGSVSWSEDGSEWSASGYLTAYLVAYDLHRSPVLVRPEGLVRLGEPLGGAL